MVDAHFSDQGFLTLTTPRFESRQVADFGLSQKRKAGVAGTPFWLAPEIIRGETGNTTESDAYAFGIIVSFFAWTVEDGARPKLGFLTICVAQFNLLVGVRGLLPKGPIRW